MSKIKINLQNIIAIIVILLITIFGVKTLISSHAQSPYASTNAASGTITSPATVQIDSSASSGKSVQFGLPLIKPLIPVSGIYLGAWTHPSVSGVANIDSFTTNLTNFNNSISSSNRKLDIAHIFSTCWTTPAPISNMNTVSSDGGMPLVDWGPLPTAISNPNCSSTATLSPSSYEQIANGSQDSVIKTYADALKAYNKPVFLRWDWEMNLKDPTHTGLGTSSEFIAAWQHIYNLFQSDGAANVAFVWCPGLSGGLSGFSTWYPGDQYVDWIAIDGYDHHQLGAATFTSNFGGTGGWYETWSSHNKPLMIAENGADSTISGGTIDGNVAEQATYLQGVQSDLDSGNYSDIKAWVYFDSLGTSGDWTLGGIGLNQFINIASDPNFQPKF